MHGQMSFNCDHGSRAIGFSSISTTDGRSRRPQSLPKLHAWAIQTANIKIAIDNLSLLSLLLLLLLL